MVVGSPDLYRSFSQYYVQGNGVHEIRLCVNINESHVDTPVCGLLSNDALHLQPRKLSAGLIESQRREGFSGVTPEHPSLPEYLPSS